MNRSLRLALGSVAVASTVSAQSQRRAILVSFDGFSEEPARMFIDSTNTPALWSMFRASACSEGSRPPFVSVTPSGHAAIWTGAYGNVNGIEAIANGALPLSQTTILETVDGYSAPPLSAEPIWISAARQGVRVFSHTATQSPGPPGYPTPGPWSAALDRTRAQASADNKRWNLAAINMYNVKIADPQLLTEATATPTVARAWRGLSSLGATGRLESRELSWAFGSGGDSLHALLVRSANGVSGVVVSTTRDASRGSFARLAPTDTTRPAARELARFFAPPLRVDLHDGRRTYVHARLFELSSDFSHFVLFVSEARITQGNRPEVARDYDARVQGVPGNGADKLLDRGAFGPTIIKGGDGAAELRYLETAELVTRQFMRGTEAGMSRYAPDLLIDYLPYPDEALHDWYALAHPSTPGVSPAVRANATRLLKRAYQLVEQRVVQLRRFADTRPGTALFVTGEHGMRPSWLSFRANVVLREAGLLSADSAGRIDLSRTLAAAARGGWVSVNRDTRKGGIVPPESVAAVLARAEQALRAARDSSGAPIVTRTWRAGTAMADSLGFGGPAGGDLYLGLAPGFYPNASAQGTMVAPLVAPRGEHGFPSVDRDMWPAFCVRGPGISAKRIGPMRAIDIAPTVSEWLRIKPPADSRGRSLLSELRSP